ncbi:MAG: hypothetical protein WD042_03365 [Phycisphaeraceae bacterium]
MKSKHLSFMDQNLEKIVVGVALLFLLVVAWLYYVGSPYSVKVQDGVQTTTMGPMELEDKILARAKLLENALNNPELPFPSPRVAEYVPITIQQLKEVPPSLTLAVPFNWGGLEIGPIGEEQLRRYAIQAPPAPAKPAVRADHAVLDRTMDPTMLTPLVHTIGRGEPPLDFSYVSAASQFNVAEWKQRLSAAGVPDGWQQMLVIYVKLQRQQWDPVAQQWGPATDVAPVPGYPVPQNEEIRPDLPPDRVGDLIQHIREQQPAIIEQVFPMITSDAVWLPPNIDPSKLNEQQRRMLRDVLLQIMQVKAQIAATQAPQMMPGEAGEAPAPGLGGDVTQLRQQLDVLHRRQRAILEGRDPDAVAPDGAVPPATFGPNIRNQPGMPIPAPLSAPKPPDKLDLLAHDLTVQPGASYRYRFVVGLFNPLFRQQIDPEQRKKMENLLAQVSEPGEWSERVNVAPEMYYFFVGASNNGRTGRWVVWKLFGGQYIKEIFEVQLGDAVGGTTSRTYEGMSVQVPMQAPVLLVDIAQERGSMDNTRAVLLNKNSGQLGERMIGEDRDNAEHQRLREEERMAAAAAAPKPEPTAPPESGGTPPPYPGPYPPGMRRPPGSPEYPPPPRP